MKAASKPAHDRLTEALTETEPDCLDDARYTADLLDNGDKKIMAGICSACPIFELCIDYALTEKPAAGWWPGVQLKALRKGRPS